VHAFVANAACDLAPDGMIVNAVHPGWVKTDMGGASAVVDPREAGENIAWLASFLDGAPPTSTARTTPTSTPACSGAFAAALRARSLDRSTRYSRGRG
jgi:NAD(P)-dependent dehydrogenase (short-subunit alcohol dehydrogenase family)